MEGLNLTTFLDVIIASFFVFGFLPILSFFLITVKVPKDEILTLSDFNKAPTKISKSLSTTVEEKFLEKPSVLYILLDKFFLVRFFLFMK